MKLLRGFAIIFFFLFLGHLGSNLSPLPLPPAIIGMALLFLALATGLVKEAWVEDAAYGLIAQMMIMFVPGGVKVMDAYDEIAGFILSSGLVCIVATIIVLVVTAFSTDRLIDLQLRRKL